METPDKIIVDDFMSLDEEELEHQYETKTVVSFKKLKEEFNLKNLFSTFVLK